MSVSIVDEIKSVLSPLLVDAAASAVAEQPEATGRAITASATEIVSAALQSARTPSALTSLFNLVRGGVDESPRLADLNSVYQGRLNSTSLGGLANQLLSLLFGGSLHDVTSRISAASGVGSSSATTLLNSTAQHVLALLGRDLAQTGDVSAASFQRLVQSRGGSISDLITEIVPGAPAPAVPASVTIHHRGAERAEHHAPAATVTTQAATTAATHTRPIAHTAATGPAEVLRQVETAKRDRDGAGFLWALPVLALLLGGLGWLYWGRTTKTESVEASVTQEAASTAIKEAVAPAPAPAPAEVAVAPAEAPAKVEAAPAPAEVAEAPAAAEPEPAPAPAEPAAAPTEPAAAPAAVAEAVPGKTDYYGETGSFKAETWVDTSYTFVAEEPVVVAEAVPGKTDYYGETSAFNAETWVDTGYTFAADAPAAETPAAEEPAVLAEAVPGKTDYYGETSSFNAETWVDTGYTFAAEAPAMVAEAVPGKTDFYGETGSFNAETWVDTNYSFAAAEPLAEPVPGKTDYYGETGSFARDVWVNQEYTVAAAEPEPQPAAAVPGKTDYYGETLGFSGEVWHNKDYDAKSEAVAKCQDAVNKALGPIRFRTSKADLTNEGRAQLDKIAVAINSCPAARVRVEGHTDSDGDEMFNQRLSEDRAKAVVAYLKSAGVDTSRLSSLGYGETHPVASNDTSDGKAQNRRIAFVVEGI